MKLLLAEPVLHDSTDTPANREIARLLAFLNEPRAVPAILAHQAAVPTTPAQIHDAYCLRAIKSGWTGTTKRQLWAWYETASRWEGGFSFLGYLDYMIQELVAQLDGPERDALLAEADKFPFPTRVLVRELDLDKEPGLLPSLFATYGRLLKSADSGAQIEDLRSLILEKLGRSSRPDAHAALRALALVDPGPPRQFARALADHPADADLPILVAALASRDPNTTQPGDRGLAQDPGQAAGSRGPGTPDPPGAPSRPVQPPGAQRAGRPVDRDRRSPRDRPASRTMLAAWEDVYRKHVSHGAAPRPRPRQPGAHTYDLRPAHRQRAPGRRDEDRVRQPGPAGASPRRGAWTATSSATRAPALAPS